jgi:hypothetical protein
MVSLISSCVSCSASVIIAIVVAIIAAIAGPIRRVKVGRRVFTIIVTFVILVIHLNFDISESLHSAAKPDTCNASWMQETQITVCFLNLDFIDVQQRASS